MGRLDELYAKASRSSWRSGAWTIVLFVALGGAWTAFAEIDEIAIAEGEVAPLNQVKVIQHLDGGIIESIHVGEGQVVRAGEALIAVELPATALNKEELEARLDGLALARARLDAESREAALALPAAEAARRAELAASEQAAFAARRTERETKVQGRKELVRQRELAIKELESNRKALANDLELALKNLAMSDDLLRDGLTSKMEHVEHERDVARISGEIESLRSAIPRARAALAEATEQLREEKQRFQREAFETLNKVELDIARTRELLSAATTQASRQVIHSPIDGIVKNLLYHTIGGVVRPGEVIMELVPMDENLVFEVRLNPADRGYVALGQRALAKVTSYDVIRYGGIEGTIVNVGADSTVDEDGTPFFKVTVKPDRTYLGAAPGELPITPGMLATVDIKTGTRTVLEYLLKPVVRLRDEAFRER